MFRIYGTPLCPDCRECRANFDIHGIVYEFRDISQSLKNLKEFLHLRDHLRVFDSCRESGRIGIPALVLENGSVLLDWEQVLREKGLPILFREKAPGAKGPI